VSGNGKATAGPAHAQSICVFSGKNDPYIYESRESRRCSAVLRVQLRQPGA
jgi:hypothetical protein